jgi:predicted ATPase
MRLKQVTIAGYRSIRKPITLHVEPAVTVVLGPNDHGKTNLLSALLHLNTDSPYANEGDLNWDSDENASSLPSVVGTFSMSQSEIDLILETENQYIAAYNQDLEKKNAAANPDTGAADEDDETEESDEDDDTPASDEQEEPARDEPYAPVTTKDLAGDFIVKRVGLKGKLEIDPPTLLFEETVELIRKLLPRFELINPVAKLSDSVSAEELAPGKNEFMRGIFYYAGLDPDAATSLFEQNDRTLRRLAQASEVLDHTLRETWSQGSSLKFQLRHDSKHQRIELIIEDPSVNSRFVRASRRSSGFTHYFALKTILYARQKDHEASSYFLMFDEPGTYLHPSGQFDLLQVLETLARESQIAYVTHSLFMINKTYPTRHRLLMKNIDGTTLDGKPYVGRWQAALSSLGMTLTGTILFANHVVLTEGDSDPIYLYAMLQKGVVAGKCRIDINSLAFMSTGESKHADVLLRLFTETVPPPKIGVITDGDTGGKDRLIYLNALVKDLGISEKALPKDTTVEDHIPNLREVYVPAVAAYTANLMTLKGENKPDETGFLAKVTEHFDKSFEKGKVTVGVAEWAAKAAMEVGTLTSKPSKVGIAREYANRLMDLPDSQLRWESRAKAIVEWLTEKVGVPETHPVEKTILQEE